MLLAIFAEREQSGMGQEVSGFCEPETGIVENGIVFAISSNRMPPMVEAGVPK